MAKKASQTIKKETVKNDKKISVNKIDKIIKSQKQKNSTFNYEIDGETTIEIIVKPTLTLMESAQMVIDVTDGVFIENDNMETIYSPVYKKINIAYAVFAYYTNLKSEMNIDKLHTIVYETDIYEKVLGLINTVQFNEILHAINENIEFRKQEMLSQEKQLLQENLKQLESYMSLFVGFTEKFKDINTNDMINLFKNISNKDEKEIAKAVLDAKSNINKTENNVVELPVIKS